MCPRMFENVSIDPIRIFILQGNRSGRYSSNPGNTSVVLNIQEISNATVEQSNTIKVFSITISINNYGSEISIVNLNPNGHILKIIKRNILTAITKKYNFPPTFQHHFIIKKESTNLIIVDDNTFDLNHTFQEIASSTSTEEEEVMSRATLTEIIEPEVKSAAAAGFMAENPAEPIKENEKSLSLVARKPKASTNRFNPLVPQQNKNEEGNKNVLTGPVFPPQLTLNRNLISTTRNSIFAVKCIMALGCSCKDSCYNKLDSNQIYDHRMYIQRLSNKERFLYLSGIIRCSPYYIEILEHDYVNLPYFSLGHKVCYEAFLFLEYCQVSQFERIRKRVIHATLPISQQKNLDGICKEPISYYVKNFILHILKLNKKYNQTDFFYISNEISENRLFEKYCDYIEYSDDLGRSLNFHCFNVILRQQLPNLVFTNIDTCKFYSVQDMNMFMVSNGMQNFAFCKGKSTNISFLEVSRKRLLKKFKWKNVHEDAEDANEIPVFTLTQIC